MPIVRMPDGTNVSFPNDMPSSQIQSLIAQKFPSDVAGHMSDMANAIHSGMSWTDVAKSAVQNTPRSAAQFGQSVAQPFIHPVETAQNIANIGKGVLQKLGLMSGRDSEKYADAVGKFFMDRYGSEQAIKHSIATDPVGTLADAATILSGGETALARAPGIAGKVGEVAGTVGRAIDPLSAAGKVAKLGGRVASEAAGVYTGAGSEAIQAAAKAGAKGGEAGKAFRDSLLGNTPMEQVISEAKSAVQQMKLERGNIYRQEMAKIGANKKVLDFNKIDDAVKKVAAVKTYKGQVLSTKTAGIRNELIQTVDDWKNLDPKEFHTPEGLDALKQKIGEIRDSTPYGTPERLVADGVYKAVYNTITKEAPDYAKVMKGYEEASSLIKEMETTLSLNPKASVDTSLRKLQSVLRNNVSTNYGRRAELVQFLQRAGAPNLIEKIAGQSLSAWAPRGLSRLIIGGEGAAALMNPGHAAYLGAGIAGSSPILNAGAAYGLGAASRISKPIGRSAFQIGRLPQ